MKIEMKDIKKYVKEYGFCLKPCSEFGIDFISQGISYVLRETQTEHTGRVGETHIFWLELYNACTLFKNDNFGNMYEYEEEVVKGNEYGKYKTSVGDIVIHRENNVISAFFLFER